MKIKDTLNVLKQIYRGKKYIYITLIVAVVSFVIFYKLLLAKIANHSLKIFIMMSGYNFTYFSLLSFVIISVLSGIYISIIVYKFDIRKKMIVNLKTTNKKGLTETVGFFGIIAGVFGAGCPTCGAVFFSLIGAPLALMYFPFKGLELRLLSIVILLIAIYVLSKSLVECDVKLTSKDVF